MRSPLQMPATWYFWLAVVSFLGTLVLDGAQLAFSLNGDRLFMPAATQSLPVYFLFYIFAVIAGYLALLYFYYTWYLPQGFFPVSSWDRVWFALLATALVVAMVSAQGALLILGADLIALSANIYWRSRFTASGRAWGFALHAGLLALGLLGVYALLCLTAPAPYWFQLTHPWLGGAVVLLWVTTWTWLLLDRGIIRPHQAERLLITTGWMILLCSLAGLILHIVWIFTGWHLSELPGILRLVELIPLSWLILREVVSKDRVYLDGTVHWTGWSWVLILSGLTVAFLADIPSFTIQVREFHFKSLIWPFFLAGLVLFPARHGRQLGIPFQARALGTQGLLRFGLSLYFLSFWQVALVSLNSELGELIAGWGRFWHWALALAGCLLTAGYLYFLSSLFWPAKKRRKNIFPGESHISE
ncbi:MAG: hypothetical protein H0Z38_05140 [Firmicutes bacterium]|nr:hypothetical protein [Bacillota bacterium]